MGVVASKYSNKVNRKIQCTLCPHMCLIHEGNMGKCGVRGNLGGKIAAKNYGCVSGLAVDPIEKKPLYHFFPGQKILSIGSLGCNLKCNFCQNWQISQNCEINNVSGIEMTPEEIADKAKNTKNNIGVAYTYNEPTVWFEFMLDTAKKIKHLGLYNVMVSNGYINKEPLIELIEYIDAFNIDLKAFSDSFYKEMAKGDLRYVLNTIKTIRSYNKHIEITNLVIPGKNDNVDQFSQMVEWIATEIGEETVLHISRYFPRYKQVISPTGNQKLEELRQIAQRVLKHVYIGNVDEMNNTLCSNCGASLIRRSAYSVNLLSDFDNGLCVKCGNKLMEYAALRQ